MSEQTFTPGIYLEVTKGQIGTGSTAKTEEYRSFWLAVEQKGDAIDCVLLDNDFNMTGMRQMIPLDEFQQRGLKYIPQGEKRYQILIKKLNQARPAAPKPPPAQKPAAPAAPKPANWWEAPPKDIKPGDIFNRPEGDRPAAKEGESSGGAWWEAGKSISKPKPAETQQTKKPKSKSGTPLKKTWWDK